MVATPLVISACELDKTADWPHCGDEGAGLYTPFLDLVLPSGRVYERTAQ
jgi:hypothetical protein